MFQFGPQENRCCAESAVNPVLERWKHRRRPACTSTELCLGSARRGMVAYSPTAALRGEVMAAASVPGGALLTAIKSFIEKRLPDLALDMSMVASHHDIPCRTCRFFRVRRPDRGGVDPEPSIGEPPPRSGKSAITRDQFEASCIRLCLASHLTRPSHGFPKDKCRMPRAYRTARVQEKAHAAVPAD